MASKVHSVIGTASYPKLFEFNRDKADFYADVDGCYTIDVFLEQDEMNKLSATKSRLKPKISEEGISVKFRRPHMPKNGIEALGGAPKVVDADDNIWDTEKLIGNGSTVEVFFSVYDSKFGTGTRLEGVRVLELEEYEGTGSNGLPF